MLDLDARLCGRTVLAGRVKIIPADLVVVIDLPRSGLV